MPTSETAKSVWDKLDYWDWVVEVNNGNYEPSTWLRQQMNKSQLELLERAHFRYKLKQKYEIR